MFHSNSMPETVLILVSIQTRILSTFSMTFLATLKTRTDVLIEDTDAQPSTARLSDIALNVLLSQCLGSQKEVREYLRSHREPIKT